MLRLLVLLLLLAAATTSATMVDTFRRISDYDPFLDMDILIAQIPCLVGSSQPLSFIT